MPEYLAPGVYVEETSFRSKSIEGVSTSTAGFIGPARFGPVSGPPELLTSLADFERVYGGLEDLQLSGGPAQTNYLWHAVWAFFQEGGQRLYVSRVFNFSADGNPVDLATILTHYASTTTLAGSPPGLPSLILRARFPGAAGRVRATFTLRTGANALTNALKPGSTTERERGLSRVQDFDVVQVRTQFIASPPARPVYVPYPTGSDGLHLAYRVPDPVKPYWRLVAGGASLLLSDLPNDPTLEVRPVTVVVEVERPIGSDPTVESFAPATTLGEFGFDPRSAVSLSGTLTENPVNREDQLTLPLAIAPPDSFDSMDKDEKSLYLARELMTDAAGSRIDNLLVHNPTAEQLQVRYTLDNGGNDGAPPTPLNYEGDEEGFQDATRDPLQMPKNGLLAFEAVDDISIVAAPGYSAVYGNQEGQDRTAGIQNAVINHCEKLRYRVAVLDTPPNQTVTGALAFRNLRSSNYAAIYYPWIIVPDPQREARLKLPPSGFVSGIWARNDVLHSVAKAPANEVVRLAIDFEQRLNKAQQEALNPDGVNCSRFFEGHGFLLWGARTISDDPEWKYVNVRRYFAYLEHSIDRGTQWVVFENNSQQLWANVRRTVEDFLYNEWKMGSLMGSKPEEAFFVRCDRSTMTQNDLDNGRLICLIGVAPVKPAEFVIFRIGQWTASGNQ